MSARSTIALIASLTALAAPAVATARPAEVGVGGSAASKTAPVQSTPISLDRSSAPAATHADGTSTLLVLIVAGCALLVGVAAATGTGRMRARHGALRS